MAKAKTRAPQTKAAKVTEFEIAPGEIWSVATCGGAGCSLRVADDALRIDGGGAVATIREHAAAGAASAADEPASCALLCFAQHADEARRTGWPQARYYEDAGKTVADFLSYNAVYEINPFEIGARRPETRKTFRERMRRIERLLDLRKLMDRLVIALSNGETRRVLLARALAKGPRLLALDDPAAGLDAKQRGKLKEIIRAIANRGAAVVLRCRHADELPSCVTRELHLAGGRFTLADCQHSVAPRETEAAAREPKAAKRGIAEAPAVIEIANLNLAYGDHVLFSDFSWKVRRGERWVLRGENGSGKTTLFALIIGDSPLAYAADIKVFGLPREVGIPLAQIRDRIGIVSPEMQAYLGKSAEELLRDALAREPALLLLDEPFMNLGRVEARKAARCISAYLRAHKSATAVLICHRADEIPPCFTRELTLH